LSISEETAKSVGSSNNNASSSGDVASFSGEGSSVAGNNSNDRAEQTNTITAFSINAHSTCVLKYDPVILSTAIINVSDELNQTHQCRALLESGSQSNFIMESMVQILKLRKSRIDHTVRGIGEAVHKISASVIIAISSRINNFSTYSMCLVVPRITNK
jgi:hypothetical protein